jgi:multiple antibiotic resistance protein
MNQEFIGDILTNSLYLLALINPISKICILSVFSKEMESQREMNIIVVKSTFIALMILFMVMMCGDFIFKSFLRVDLYSLKIAGGIVLFWVGFKALSKGIFFETSTQNKLAEISIVPLASPMIAGPATIAAVLPMAVSNGMKVALGAVLVAVMVNMVLMLMSKPLGAILTRFNVMGALIRITGLIVATIGVQMTLSGFSVWIQETASMVKLN